jgi:NAD(P)H dehydrogenase (quinone)
MSILPNIIVIYHSGYGHTKKLAEAVFEGVKTKTTNASLLSVNDLTEASWEELAKADALIFGSPTYMGGPSAKFKEFADASSKPWFKQLWKNKIAAGFTNSATINGDKFATIAYLWTLSQQHGMIWAGTGMQAANSKAATRNDINYLGGYGGLLGQSPSDASPEEGLLPGDAETAKLFGARIADVTAHFVRGNP